MQHNLTTKKERKKERKKEEEACGLLWQVHKKAHE
jgi:hypothetical protein